MNFLEVRKNLAHMLSEDPLGIKNPLTYEGVNEEELDITNPVSDIKCNWHKDYVRIRDKKKDLTFSVPYEGRTEGEVVSEIVSMISHLKNK